MMADPRVVGGSFDEISTASCGRASRSSRRTTHLRPTGTSKPWRLRSPAYSGRDQALDHHRAAAQLKSICASVAYPAYVLGHDPARRIICVSYAEGLARKHANDCRALMRSTLYHRLFPNTRISPAKDTELEFATTRGGNRLSTSVGGTLTGRGGNLIIVDDPQKPQDAHSETVRSTMQWYSNTC